MIRRPPRSTQSRSSAASDVYKRQVCALPGIAHLLGKAHEIAYFQHASVIQNYTTCEPTKHLMLDRAYHNSIHLGVPVSYTHLRAHETVLDLVCRLLLEKKKQTN